MAADRGPYDLWLGDPLVQWCIHCRCCGINRPDTHQLFIFSATGRKSEPAVVLFIFLLLSGICHLHSSSFAFINQFIITALPCAALSVPSCPRDGLSAVPGAHIDIGVVTLGFMRHVMVCFSTVFTPQCVSVFFSTKAQNAGVNFQDGYWAGACLPVVSNKGWMCDCDVCLFSLFSLTFCVSICVYLCGGEWGRQRERLNFVVWSNLMWLGSPISIYASV